MQRLMVVACLVAACGEPVDDVAADEFRAASPSRQGLAVAFPESGGQALEGEARSPLLGETANLYVLTRAVTATMNGGFFFVRALVEGIIRNPPTTFDGQRAVWGPHTEPLSPTTYRFTIKRTAAGFDYVLEGRWKDGPPSEWIVLLTGHHEPGAKATGAFLIDWDAAQGLRDPPREIGTAQFSYVRHPAGDLELATQFRQVRDEETGQRIDADSVSLQVVGGDGSLDFSLDKDMHGGASGVEQLQVRSRWTQNGAGRSDVALSGGDLPQQVTMSECWSTSFGRMFYVDSVGFEPTEGAEADCAFRSASFAR